MATDKDGARRFAPASANPTLPQLRAAATTCRGCDLYRNATQTVFGEGPRSARIMFVGEQPGDLEDQEGRPFVGPAGKLLAKALAEAGMTRKSVYLTNVVKHFKWKPRGKRRIHSKPSGYQIEACRPWLELELSAVRPRAIVLLGATAAQSLLGRAFRVTRERGKPIEGTPWAPVVVATMHPSSVLRAPDDERRHEQYGWLVSDLKVASEHAA